MSPTDKPLSAVFNLAIGEYAIEKFHSSQNVGSELSCLDVERINGNDLEDLRKKLHKFIDYHMDSYIDFLYGN